MKNNLPRLILIGDGFVSGREELSAEDVRKRIMTAVSAGVKWVHLRDYRAYDDDFHAVAARFIQELLDAEPDLLISINSREEAARKFDTALHLGYTRLTPEVARKIVRGKVVSASIHNEEQLNQRRDADALLFSPVFETSSKPETKPTGLKQLAAICRAAKPTPVYALGGITPDRVQQCRDAGAYGTAVLSNILHADDVSKAVKDFLMED